MLKWILPLVLVISVLAIPGCPPHEKPAVKMEQVGPLTHETSPVAPAPVPSWTPPTSQQPKPAFGSVAGRTIVVDPGHGGKDPGSMGDGLPTMTEKKINLLIAKELAEELKALGAKVVLTRASDKFLELEERAAIAEKYHADLFVSIHSNSNPDSSKQGVVVYTDRAPTRQSMIAAMVVSGAIHHAGISADTDRANYKVLALNSKPAILIESGYLTNTADCKRLNSASYRSHLAAAIAQGIANYFAR